MDHPTWWRSCASTTSTSAADNPALTPPTSLLGEPIGRGQPIGRTILADRAPAPPPAPNALTAGRPIAAQHKSPRRLSPPPGAAGRGPQRLYIAQSAKPTPLPGNPHKIDGSPITVTPPANAKSHSPSAMTTSPNGSPLNDDEQGYSLDTAGPCSPNTYDTRPEATRLTCRSTRTPCSPSVSLLP